MEPVELIVIGFESAFSDHSFYSDIKQPGLTRFMNHEAYKLETTTPEEVKGVKTTLYIDRKSFMPLGYSQQSPGEKNVSTSFYKDVKTHVRLTAKDFAWSPPKTARLLRTP